MGSITDIHVFDLQFPLYPNLEAKMDRIERRREHIRTVSIYGKMDKIGRHLYLNLVRE